MSEEVLYGNIDRFGRTAIRQQGLFDGGWVMPDKRVGINPCSSHQKDFGCWLFSCDALSGAKILRQIS